MGWYNINLSDVYLCGISQGGYTAMDMAYYSKNLAKDGEALGGVVTFGSGMLGAHTRPDAEGFNSKPKALLIHGAEDDLVPHDLCVLTEKTLKKHGVNVQRYDIPNQKHAGIDWAGADIAVQQISKWMQEREAQNRITSYNVCYTKLLRLSPNLSNANARSTGPARVHWPVFQGRCVLGPCACVC